MNRQTIALKQLVAFAIDLFVVSMPLVVMLDMTGAFIFWFLWAFYIPFCEYKYAQTLGMKIIGTKIYGVDSNNISFATAFRRHIARISLLWGVTGWLFLFFGRQYACDYIITTKDEFAKKED